MKDIVCPDPWTTMTFHSFHSTVVSCNKDHDLLMWDWNSSRETGHINSTWPHTGITSARFVNELHEQIVILAEIGAFFYFFIISVIPSLLTLILGNGDIHILAGPQDSSRIRPIANFGALNMQSSRNMSVEDEDHRTLVTTWFRASGKLCVGGASEVVNVWDCPAERCVQVNDEFGTDRQNVKTDGSLLNRRWRPKPMCPSQLLLLCPYRAIWYWVC